MAYSRHCTSNRARRSSVVVADINVAAAERVAEDLGTAIAADAETLHAGFVNGTTLMVEGGASINMPSAQLDAYVR